ncbi:MAG: T9SS type A sorting domain-containing protein, partial [Melioribacteraceae bacterium]|nr:T9SS type A sorting domain-containing protein [Melioribacteraceae bacterium]
LTDEAPSAQTSMNEIRILNDKTGEEIGSMELSPQDEDHWWAVATSNDNNFTFIGWGNGENFYGSVIKSDSNQIIKTDQRFYISNIEQYYYSIAWLEHLSKFIAIAKVNDNSVVCLIDTNGVRSAFTSIPDAPLTRETDLAVRWNGDESEYLIVYTSGQQDITLLSVSTNAISLEQINEQIINDTNWPPTGISCQFVQASDGSDLWYSDRKILIVHNDENSNNAVYHNITVEDLTDINIAKDEIYPNGFKLYPAYPNPFNPSVKISYSISNEMDIQIYVYNLRGELITTLVNSNKPKGRFSVEWQGLDNNNHTISSGIYIVRLIAGEYVQSQKIIFQK